ncbi:MAG: hypothetical protein JW888_08015 [Pirellulales bacterium]|nr:hypothetical protein [Pirellulales bacterium]
MASMSPARSVLLCEPQCWGFEHAPFNAALLSTVCLAYPSAKIVYYGEPSHLEYTRNEFGRFRGEKDVCFAPVRAPRRELTGARRLPREFSLCRRMLAEASRDESQALIFCSITSTSLLSLKLLMKTRRFHRPTAAVVHGCLANVAGPQPRRPWNWLLDLRRVLALPHPSSLRLIALGNSIRANLEAMRPRQSHQWSSMDHVYLWPDASLAQDALPGPNRPPRFGYLGVASKAGGKGFDTFCQLTEDVAPSRETAEFTVAGFYLGPVNEKPICPYVRDIPDEPLSREAFEQRVRQITYVVSTAKPEHYRLAASGTFLDALAFLKPGIYLRNDYVAHYFDQMGDIGYLCDSREEMVRTIKEIMAEFPEDRYQSQIENIKKGRTIFEPKVLAPRIREILSPGA